MPFRLANEGHPGRAKVQFTTSAAMPYLIYRACLATGTVSNTRYIQEAVTAALARDLDLDQQDLLDDLPTPRGLATIPIPPDKPVGRRRSHAHGIALAPAALVHIGPANTHEEVK